MTHKELIIGTWSDIRSNEKFAGGVRDVYFEDGTKESGMYAYEIASGMKYETLVHSVWSIEGNVLIDTIVNIDKDYSKKSKLKNGQVVRGYITELSDTTLNLKPLKDKKISHKEMQKPVVLYKVSEEN